jgi:hypothetical protein
VGLRVRRLLAALAARDPRASRTVHEQYGAAVFGYRADKHTRPLELFFVTAKQATVHGYYTSEIGIHQELKYKGNKVLLEFVGCQTVDGKDCPHCGQKAES